MDALPSIPSVLGGFIETIGISNMLFGLSASQFYVYMHNWQHDPKWMKTLAVSVILLEAVNSGFVQRAQFFYSVRPIEDPFIIASIDWSVPVALVFEVVSEILVQGFYLHRMWIFTRNIYLVVGTIFLFMARYALFINCIVDTFTAKTWAQRESGIAFKPALITTLALTMFTDIIVATTMTYYLRRRQSPIRRTQGIVSWLVLYFVSTGAILVAISLTIMIGYLVDPNSMLYAGFILIYARALANALFGALNARQQLRTKQNQIVTFGGVSLGANNITTSLDLRKVQGRAEQESIDTVVITAQPGNTKNSDFRQQDDLAFVNEA